MSAAPGSPGLVPAYPPIVVNRPGRGTRSPLRIALLNAGGGAHFDGIVQCLGKYPLNRASVIVLCEVDSKMRRSGGREVAAELASLLRMSFAYIPEFGIPDRSGTIESFMGNAILCAEPLEEVTAVALPDPAPAHPRRRGGPAGLVAVANFGGVPTTVSVVHLNSRCSPAQREIQMRAFLAQFPKRGRAILGGDFNTTTMELRSLGAIARAGLRALVDPARFRAPQRFEPLFARLAEHGLETRGVNAPDRPTFTFARAVPNRLRPKLDWLAVRELTPVRQSAAVVPARPSALSMRVSDHDFLIADVET